MEIIVLFGTISIWQLDTKNNNGSKKFYKEIED